MVQTLGELLLNLARFPDGVQPFLAQMRWQCLGLLPLTVEPGRIFVDDRLQAGAQLLVARLRQLRHVQQRRTDLLGGGLRGLARRQPRRPDRSRPPRTLVRVPVDRTGAAHRELQPVPVLEPEPPQLVIALRTRVGHGVDDGEEHVRAARLNQKLRLVEPRVYRDLARRHLVVAQRDFDEPAAALRVVVAIDPQHNLVLEGNGRGLSGYEVRDDDLRRDFDRGALVTAQRLLALLALLLDRLVDPPRRRHRKVGDVRGYLAPQAHGRGDHQPTLLWLVLGGVLIGPRAALLH